LPGSVPSGRVALVPPDQLANRHADRAADADELPQIEALTSKLGRADVLLRAAEPLRQLHLREPGLLAGIAEQPAQAFRLLPLAALDARVGGHRRRVGSVYPSQEVLVSERQFGQNDEKQVSEGAMGSHLFWASQFYLIVWWGRRRSRHFRDTLGWAEDIRSRQRPHLRLDHAFPR
jgi:hypothetical protein